MLHLVRDTRALDRLADYIRNKPRSGLRLLKRVIEYGQAYTLSRAVEKAKLQLSRGTTATVELLRPDVGINIHEDVRRDEFDMSISDDLNQVFEVIERVNGGLGSSTGTRCVSAESVLFWVLMFFSVIVCCFIT